MESSEQVFAENAQRAARWIAEREGCDASEVVVQGIVYHAKDPTIQVAKSVRISGGPERDVRLEPNPPRRS